MTLEDTDNATISKLHGVNKITKAENPEKLNRLLVAHEMAIEKVEPRLGSDVFKD